MEGDIENETPKSKQRRERRYRNWKGNHTFVCNARIMMGPHLFYFYLTVSMILITWIVYFVAIEPILNIHYYGFIIGLILLYSNIICLCLTSFTEPGVIPRKSKLWMIDSIPKDLISQLDYCSICNIGIYVRIYIGFLSHKLPS